MAMTVTIAAVNRTSYVRISTLHVNMNYRSTWTAEFQLKDVLSTSSAYRPSLDDTVVIDDDGTTIFRGWIFGVKDGPLDPPHTGTAVQVSCRSYDALLDSIIVDRVYGTDPLVIANSSVANPTTITTVQPHGYNNGARVVIADHVGGVAGINGTHVITVTSHSTFTIAVNNTSAGGGGTVREVNRANTIVTELHSTYLNSRGVSLDALSNASDLYKQVYDGVTLRKVLDSISEQTGWPYRIHPSSPQLQFFSPGSKTLAYSLTAANGLSVDAVEWEQRRERYVNTVILLYGTDGIQPQTDVFTGDGATAQFPLRYTARVDENDFVSSRGVVIEAGVSYPISPLFDIVSSSVANPSVILCQRPHGLPNGATVTIQAHSGSTPNINGSHTATVLDPFRFTIPVNVTVAGTGGTGYNAAHTWFWYEPLNMVTRISNLASETVATFTYNVQYPQRLEVDDAAEVAAKGVWAGRFSAPDVFDVDAAQTIADGILRRELAKPKAVTVRTRQTLPLPGDAVTLTFADNVVSGTHIIQTVSGVCDTDQEMRWTITAVTGNEFRDKPIDLLRDVMLGDGGVRAAGGVIVGSTVQPPQREAGNEGLFPGRVVAHLGHSGDYTGADGWQFESALDYLLNSATLGPALKLGIDSSNLRWNIAANTLVTSIPTLRFSAPANLSSARYHAQLYVPSGVNDTAYLTPHGGGAGGALHIGGPETVFGDSSFRVGINANAITAASASSFASSLAILASIAAPGTFGNMALIGGAEPILDFYESDRGANLKFWRWIVASEVFALQTLTDAYASPSNIITFQRGGTTVINQAANDGTILALESSDVAHGITDFSPTSYYANLLKVAGADGGLDIRGLTEAAIALKLDAFYTSDNTNKTTAAVGAVTVVAAKKSGTSVGNPGADANLLTINLADGTCRFIFDAEGSAHADVEWTTFDDHDDVALVASLEHALAPDAVRAEFARFLTYRPEALERIGIVHFDERPGHAVVNFTKLSMLQCGALRQLAARLDRLEAR